MKIVCPECGELQKYAVTENIKREVEFDKYGDRVGRKEEAIRIGRPHCTTCGSPIIIENDVVTENGLKANKAYADAKTLLVYYMKEVWTNAGLKWDNDNTAEVEDIVECIKMGIKEEIKEKKTERPDFTR